MAALDFPNGPSVNQQWNAPNGALYVWDGAVWATQGPASGQPAGGDLTGTYPNPTIKPASLPWTVSGAALTPTDATKVVNVPGAASTGEVFRFGTRAIRERLVAPPGWDAANLTVNSNLVSGTWTQDDVSKASWMFSLDGTSDGAFLYRTPPGGNATQLLKLDNAGNLVIPGVIANAASTVLLGNATTKLRVQANNTAGAGGGIFANRDWNSGSAQDDPSKPSWAVIVGGGDAVQFQRSPAGSTTQTGLFTFDASGNLTINGATATKAAGGSGTAWATTSDRRIKAEIGEYVPGLSAVLQLLPRAFVYNGKGGSTVGRRGWGFIADELAPVFPEAVDTYRGELDGEATDLQRVDVSNVTLALVNAVKELAAQIQELRDR